MRNPADLQEPEQMDWVTLEDKRAALRRFRKAGADRVGIPQLAHMMDLDPSTIRNGLARRDGKQECADLDDLIWLLDPLYRQQKAGMCGEVLSRPPDLSPEQALREALAMAQAGEFGNAGLRALTDLYARVKR